MKYDCGKRYCEICESMQPKFKPKCDSNDDNVCHPQICKKCHARFCCECRLKPFLVEFIDVAR